MARRATKDTFGYQQMGPTEEERVRRFIKAGDMVPETFEMEDGSFEEVSDPGASQSVFGHVAPPPDHLVESRTTHTFGHTSSVGRPGLDEGGDAGPKATEETGTEGGATQLMAEDRKKRQSDDDSTGSTRKRDKS